MSSAEAPQKIPIYPFLTKTADGATGGAEEGAKSTKDGSEKFQSEASSSEVPECVLRAIYPERYNDSNQPSKSEAYAQSLQNVHDCKKATYIDIIVPFLEEQRRKGISDGPGELGST